jgi:hypothetical protein
MQYISSYIILMNRLIVCVFIPFLLTGATQNSIRVAQVSSENPLNLYLYNRNFYACSFMYDMSFSGCFKSLVQQVTWDALERTSLVRR